MKFARFLTLFLLLAAPLAAQPPAPANPKAPALNPIFPLGAQRGTTIDLTLSGSNLQEPVSLYTSFSAKVTIPTDANNGKAPASLRVKIEVPKDAPLGFHAIRLATKNGVSNARVFCIDDLPQVLETVTNRTVKTAQAVTAPCVVAGKADAEITDYFKVTVKANQRLSFEVIGRRLGSRFDPQLTLLDAAGKELAGGYSNDAPGLQTDARLTYTFKNAGDYIVAIRDVSYAGGPDFYYRLRIGDFPCATTPLPLAIKRGAKASIKFAGPQVEGVAAVEVQAPTDPTVAAVAVAPKGSNGLHGWPVELLISDLDEQMEKEPNDEPAKANRLNVPGAITGRFEQKEDVDCYVFKAQKGKRYIIESHTQEHHSPTEVYMVLKNDKGQQLLASNPQLPQARLDFTAPADGDYTLVVEHLLSWHGPEEVYRLSITPFTQDFNLALNIDRWDVAATATLSIPIFVTRSGYAGAIEVSVVGLKGITGTVTIPAGPPKPPNVPSGTLTLTATDLPAQMQSFTIQGKATIDGKPVIRVASVRNIVSTAFGTLPVPPRVFYHNLALAVTQKPPVKIEVKADAAEANPGKPITLTVTLTRQAGFTAEVPLQVVGLIPGVTAVPAKVPANMNTVKVTINLTPAVKPGNLSLTLQSTVKHEARDFLVRAAPVAIPIKLAPKK